MEAIELKLQCQKRYFAEQGEVPINHRISALQKLKAGLMKYEAKIEYALKSDLGKPAFESYATEIGYLHLSINHALKNLRKWTSIRRVRSEVAQMVGSSQVYPSPYGVVLIVGPFNYPVQLLLEPLIGAIAGGNVAMLKPSELTPNVEKIMVKLISELFDENYISIVTGDEAISEHLLKMPFDYIFFTGSVRVGKLVMEKASAHLTPITLELGGKSPVIVDETADLILAAKRIVWGKFVNAGQTCVAPDYVLVHQAVYDIFLEKIQAVITQFYGKNPKESPDYGRIVNERHANRLQKMIEENREKLLAGGDVDLKECYVAPTLFKNITLEDSLMNDEIFGPLLPILAYNELKDIDKYLHANPKPLAFYVFSENEAFSEKLIKRYAFGGGCVNDTITHVASFGLPFGGVGPSGMGRYHGEASFKTFTYEKSIVKRSTKISVSLLFPPYKNKRALLKKIIK